MEEFVYILTQTLRSETHSQPRAYSFWQEFAKLDTLTVSDFAILSAGTPRRIGREKMVLDNSLQSLFEQQYPSLLDKTIGFYGRFILAVMVKNSECVNELITRGCDEEQAATIMALNFRQDAPIYKDLVVHACRTNSTLVHSAVSQNNPYPAEYFNDQEFKQLVIKTIFMGLDFDKIIDLEKRFTGDLGKSLADFFEERRAAGRWLPDNVLKFMKLKGLL